MKTYYKQIKNVESYMMLDDETSQVGGIINQTNAKNVSITSNINFYNRMVTESQDSTLWLSITEESYTAIKSTVISFL